MNLKKIYAWSIHIFTSLGAVLGVLAIIYAMKANEATILSNNESYLFYLKLSIYTVIIAIIIDAVDGTLARTIDIKTLAPFDGALLDNIIDFMTYSIVPCIWMYVANIVSPFWLIPSIIMITIASSYQFCQPNAKSSDHFFVGFPSYWNIIIMLMICFQSSQTTNLIVIIFLTICSFIPVKYIYLSRLDFVSNSIFVKIFLLTYAIIASLSTIVAIVMIPNKTPNSLIFIILSFITFYTLFSVKLTLKPLK